MEFLGDSIAVNVGERAERRFPCVQKFPGCGCSAADHKDVLPLGDRIGYDVGGNLHLCGARQRLDCVGFYFWIQGVYGSLASMGIDGIEEVMFTGIEYLIEIFFLEDGFLYLKAVFSKKG